eukprot:TRINITY_DN120937_c0_g1_i1.p1 TRINITY_DN120937_c0_g1~~TRINITY_DN120937_c0_g1_i1.p1  ORF type:complete len:289 (+),score=65.82 TRINITY_DN120937_c0_g1_i1:95-961(+)
MTSPAGAPPLEALAAFLGEAPSQAALRGPGSGGGGYTAAHGYAAAHGGGRPPVARRARDDSDSEDDEAPCFDGGFDENRDYDNDAPYATVKPARMREFDESKNFDCMAMHQPVADVAAKRSAGANKARQQRGGLAKSASLTDTGMIPEPGSFAEFMASDKLDTPPAVAATKAQLRPQRSERLDEPKRSAAPKSAAELDLATESSASALSRQRRSPVAGATAAPHKQCRTPAGAAAGAGAATLRKAAPSGGSSSSMKTVADVAPATPAAAARMLDPLGATSRRRFGGRA